LVVAVVADADHPTFACRRQTSVAVEAAVLVPTLFLSTVVAAVQT
jgi:hypothetical protein